MDNHHHRALPLGQRPDLLDHAGSDEGVWVVDQHLDDGGVAALRRFDQHRGVVLQLVEGVSPLLEQHLERKGVFRRFLCSGGLGYPRDKDNQQLSQRSKFLQQSKLLQVSV